MSAIIRPGITILFQGDSITDVERSRSVTSGHSWHALGSGYACMAAAQLLANRPGDDLTIYNRGVSGNRIVDLYARMKSDTIDLQPDILQAADEPTDSVSTEAPPEETEDIRVRLGI